MDKIVKFLGIILIAVLAHPMNANSQLYEKTKIITWAGETITLTDAYIFYKMSNYIPYDEGKVMRVTYSRNVKHKEIINKIYNIYLYREKTNISINKILFCEE